ncbi:MAG: tRNA (adenosine(37)-N6)-threonylcarbamoyltransferase complex transferase subunit TsaD [Bacillota bacterium]
MYTLAVETSCDDTSAAVVENGTRVLSNIISSQVKDHRRFGGVVPEIASRKHLENTPLVIKAAMEEARLEFRELETIAVTYGPGLVGALLVGLSTAKAMAYALDIPLVGVNHILGHLYAAFIDHDGLEPPLVALVVSGGHTTLVHMQDHGQFRVLGRTRDDAAGEAFDKVARAIGLGYPGGPPVENMARSGNPQAFSFPRSWLEEGSLDFSFSGLKTAVVNNYQRSLQKGEPVHIPDLTASFQQAVVEVLMEKTFAAVRLAGAKRLVLAGGVAANGCLRRCIAGRGLEEGVEVYVPEPVYCTDNAAMIGCASYYQYCRGDRATLSLNAVPGLTL